MYFCHKEDMDFFYNGEYVDGKFLVTWSENGIEDSMLYKKETAELYFQDGTWILVKSRQQRLFDDYYSSRQSLVNVTKLVVAVKLPTGATELIINSEFIATKMEYYMTAYDDELRLKNNKEIQIIDYLFA